MPKTEIPTKQIVFLSEKYTICSKIAYYLVQNTLLTPTKRSANSCKTQC